MKFLKKNDTGPEVIRLQELLNLAGFKLSVDGDFGPQTYAAVRAFQTQHTDQHGEPLVIDGRVGPLTWYALKHPELPQIIDLGVMPGTSLGGSVLGRAGLAMAVQELRAGAGEEGGNNLGSWVTKYLAPANMPAGHAWCAAFVSWCFYEATGQDTSRMPFAYEISAKQLQRTFNAKGWGIAPEVRYTPLPGDLVFWWRIKEQSWQGHVGIVHSYQNGYLYTIEGNKGTQASPLAQVQGFRYVLGRMDKLLGFGHIPD
ncbi:MAG: CHAP domain-containing protein [Bacteroidia bacterium]|nr:CHAP domain-containing protein [Bacteroidia bacterium]